MGETTRDLMQNDPTPINTPPKRRHPETLEDLSLALREHLLWPVEDRLLGLGDRGPPAVAGGAVVPVLGLGARGRAAVAGGAVVLALGLGIGSYSLLGSGSSEPAATNPVAVVSER